MTPDGIGVPLRRREDRRFLSGRGDVTGDKLNGVPCAWGIVGRDGKPMKEPPHRCWHAARCAISATRWR